MRKLSICPNTYYNYLKNRKADYYPYKADVKFYIREIYHSHGSIDGYLCRKGFGISRLTVHKYINTEMQLFLISREMSNYECGTAHKVYENRIAQDFATFEINQKWCADFTYLILTDGSKRYISYNYRFAWS